MIMKMVRCIGGLGLLILTLTAAGGHDAGAQDISASPPEAALTPCADACADAGRMQLTVSAAGARHPLATYTSLMKTVDQVRSNAAGNIVIVGELESGETAIDVVKPGLNRPLAEFWTNAYGISRSGDLVAFTAAVAAHGPGANYANTMIYVFDAGLAAEPQTLGPNPPKSAIPVFPQVLAERGYPYLMHISARRLLSVATADLKWSGDASFLFLVNGPPASGSKQIYIPIAVAAGPGGDWRKATVSRSEREFTCDGLDAGDVTVDHVLTTCDQSR